MMLQFYLQAVKGNSTLQIAHYKTVYHIIKKKILYIFQIYMINIHLAFNNCLSVCT